MALAAAANMRDVTHRYVGVPLQVQVGPRVKSAGRGARVQVENARCRVQGLDGACVAVEPGTWNRGAWIAPPPVMQGLSEGARGQGRASAAGAGKERSGAVEEGSLMTRRVCVCTD